MSDIYYEQIVGWEKAFESAKHELKDISLVLSSRDKFYPLRKDVFNAFKLTALDKVKVVIIGHNPYHKTLNNGLPKACGLSFSVRKIDGIPDSLLNIFKELRNSIENFSMPNHGDLSSWARQGVLLLNRCLTVDAGIAKSHGQLWIGFITRIIDAINQNRQKCIFVLWGSEAQSLIELIDSKSIILKAMDPDGYDAKKGFFGCNHFNLINQHLVKLKETPIDWNLDDI